MTKYETLEYARPNEIIQAMLVPEEQCLMKNIVDEFYRYKYDVPSSVYNGALIFAIMKSRENLRLPNIVYLRKVMETFQAAGIISTAAVIKFFEDKKAFDNKRIKSPAEPEWMDDYVKKIEEEDKALGN